MSTVDPIRALPIAAARSRAEARVTEVRRANTRAVTVALGASALSAFLTALPSAMGTPLAGSWRITCMVAAILSAIAAVTTGLQAQLRFADRLTSATDCLGRLRALEVQLSLGTLQPDAAAREFTEIIARYPEFT